MRRLFTFLYWYIGIIAIGAGTYNILVHDTANHFATVFVGGLYDVVEIPLPYTHYLLPILPLSAILLGASLIVLERKFSWRALPLLMMGAGAYDITSQWQPPIWTQRIVEGQFWAYFQLAQLLGGWALAGFPSLKGNRYLAILIISYVIFSSTEYYIIFEGCLYLYIYKAAEPNAWIGKKLSITGSPRGTSPTAISSSSQNS